MIEPHGGRLVNRYLSPEEGRELKRRAQELPKVTLNARAASDLDMIAQGAFSPLEGFMASGDYRRVLEEMRLESGLPWSLPVTLAVDREGAARLSRGREVALHDEEGKLLGLMRLEDAYSYDKGREAELVYRTLETAHPGVAGLYQQGDVLLGGPVRVLLPASRLFAEHCLMPDQTRALFAQRGWERVVGFQTRNPVHRAHEYIQKCALELVDGLLLHPLVGETKGDDIPADVRMRCYQVLLEGYYPRDRVVLSVFPAFMRYAGPREAIFHALVRKNYGCSHFIVGRDHAGVGNYYGTYDAQQIFQAFPPQELGVTPMFFENSFYCRRCEGMATAKTCSHNADSRVSLSGTQVRAMLSQGQFPPPEFTRPEVAQVLVAANRPVG